eukprot:scaffold3091_cov349-Prasinococcus_capsulatus_cf.AAC.2
MVMCVDVGSRCIGDPCPALGPRPRPRRLLAPPDDRAGIGGVCQLASIGHTSISIVSSIICRARGGGGQRRRGGHDREGLGVRPAFLALGEPAGRGDRPAARTEPVIGDLAAREGSWERAGQIHGSGRGSAAQIAPVQLEKQVCTACLLLVVAILPTYSCPILRTPRGPFVHAFPAVLAHYGSTTLRAGAKAATSPTIMVQVASPSTALSSPMRTSCSSILALESFPWQMRAQTRTVPRCATRHD